MLKKKYQNFLRGNKPTLAAFALQVNIISQEAHSKSFLGY